MKYMGIRLGPWDPLQLSFNILNALMKKGLLNLNEVKEVLKNTLPPEMSEEEKQNIINSMIQPNN